MIAREVHEIHYKFTPVEREAIQIVKCILCELKGKHIEIYDSEEVTEEDLVYLITKLDAIDSNEDTDLF